MNLINVVLVITLLGLLTINAEGSGRVAGHYHTRHPSFSTRRAPMLRPSFTTAFVVTTATSSSRRTTTQPTFLRNNNNKVTDAVGYDKSRKETMMMTRTAERKVNQKVKNPWTVHDAELLHRAYSQKHVPSTAYINPTTTPYDYIVIGSGIGGLWLAACLAKFNQTCLVLEQHYTAGGLQHEFSIQGYEFVPGLHYIANLPLVGPMYDMVASTASMDPPLRFTRAGNCTLADHGECCSHDLAVGDLPVLHVREGLEQNRQELLSVFPNETAAIDKFLSYVESAKWQSGIFSTLKMIKPAWLQWFLSQILCSSYIHTASKSTEDILRPLTKDGRLHTVLSLFAGDLGESLGDGSFAMQAAVMGHVMEGCYYPESGPAQLVRGLVPTIRSAGGDVLVKAPVQEILIQNNHAVGVKLRAVNADHHHQLQQQQSSGDCLYAKRGVVSDAGLDNTLEHLLPPDLVKKPNAPLRKLYDEVKAAGKGAISHCFGFVGLNASAEELGLRSSSYYYLPWNTTDKEMDATFIQDYYRDTLLDPNVLDVSAGWVFVSAKDPYYSNMTMPGKTTVIIFSEAKTEDFEKFVDDTAYFKGARPHAGKARPLREAEYEAAKKLVERKMMRGLLRCFPHLEPYVDVVEIGTPLTLLDYTHRMVTLGLRHNSRRLTSQIIRPDCPIPGLYFTGQDVCFAGWAGAMTGALVTAQLLLGYNLFSLLSGKTLMRDLGAGNAEDLVKEKMQKASKTKPLEVLSEIMENAITHIKTHWLHRDKVPKMTAN